MKSEAGGVLGEVRRKLTETIKGLEVLKSLKKLRDIRKQEAERKGESIHILQEELKAKAFCRKGVPIVSAMLQCDFDTELLPGKALTISSQNNYKQ